MGGLRQAGRQEATRESRPAGARQLVSKDFSRHKATPSADMAAHFGPFKGLKM